MDPPSTAAHQLGSRRDSFASQDSQTAKEFIDDQTRLEADAREILPYSFDSCTHDLGPLRQSLFSCLTCNPPPANADDPYSAAAVCYSCSIVCHGEHTLVELFQKRNFVCDCGTSRLPSTSPCSLRVDPKTGRKGVHSQEAASTNTYNDNFRNKFCGCGESYDPNSEKGTMFQCLGLGSVATGGCGEDWWHPECLIGISKDWYEESLKKPSLVDEAVEELDEDPPMPPGFPEQDDWAVLICYKCVESNPNTWIFSPVYQNGGMKEELPCETQTHTRAPESSKEETDNPKKRKAEDKESDQEEAPTKRTKEACEASTLATIEEEPKKSILATIAEQSSTTATSEMVSSEPVASEKVTEDKVASENQATPENTEPKHASLPSKGPTESFSLFLKENFYDKLCHCTECFPNLLSHPQLREEEDTYEPPLSENGDASISGTGSLLERGEAALSTVDRVRAIEGAMVYTHLRDKVKTFLKPYAESGQAVSAEDVKAYFEKLRGDEQGIRDAAGQAGTGGDVRREQSG
ncbi:hypothetical protein N7495_009308 [Penicillium taxi]|uniref:uncharacterized protein n=1 Tax=Penicillium taxi TaxID=168475 RepID=UPI002545B892|nr:uncharacterized protein N7495_009308 [Penicillium taxi]KAJ5884798.1 hypothetical protein N7495_009308 [Penicillium taxi]